MMESNLSAPQRDVFDPFVSENFPLFWEVAGNQMGFGTRASPDDIDWTPLRGENSRRVIAQKFAFLRVVVGYWGQLSHQAGSPQ